KMVAIAFPIPLPPPVTMAVLLSNRNMDARYLFRGFYPMSAPAKIQYHDKTKQGYNVCFLNTAGSIRYHAHEQGEDSAAHNRHYQERGGDLGFLTQVFYAQCKYGGEHDRHKEGYRSYTIHGCCAFCIQRNSQ